MKATIDREALRRAVSAANAVLPSRSTPKPILRNLKLDAGDVVTIEATDLEVALRVTLPPESVTVERPGAVLIVGERLHSILGEQNCDSISLNVDDREAILATDDSRYRLPLENVLEFPSISSIEKPLGDYEVNARSLAEAVRRTSFAVDNESSRYAMGALLWEAEQKTLGVVGCDGRRISHVPVPLASVAMEKSALLIPQKPLKVLSKLLDADGVATVAFSNSAMTVEFGGALLYSRLVEGRFPRWQDVFPNRKSESIELTTGPLLGAVRRAAMSASEESRGMDWKFKAGTLNLRTRSEGLGNSEAELPVSFHGDFEITLDPRYVSDFLRVLDPEAMVTMEVKDSDSAVIFSDQSGHRYACMPLARLN